MSARAPHPPIAPELPWVVQDDGITLRIRANPRSARNAIKGIIALPDGPALIIAITAPPADGAANTAIIQTLSKMLKLPKSAVRIISGDTARIKRVAVAGDASTLTATLSQYISEN
jgi:hypothetical protein